MSWSKVDQALQNLRGNAWRFNAETKAYDRVDEDVAVVEGHIKKLERELEVMNEAESNYQTVTQRISAGWEDADRRARFNEVELRRVEILRAMAEAELAEVQRKLEVAWTRDQAMSAAVVRLSEELSRLKEKS